MSKGTKDIEAVMLALARLFHNEGFTLLVYNLDKPETGHIYASNVNDSFTGPLMRLFVETKFGPGPATAAPSGPNLDPTQAAKLRGHISQLVNMKVQRERQPEDQIVKRLVESADSSLWEFIRELEKK